MKDLTSYLGLLIIGAGVVILAITAHSFIKGKEAEDISKAKIAFQNPQGTQVNNQKNVKTSTGGLKQAQKSEFAKDEKKKKIKHYEKNLETLEQDFADKRKGIENRYCRELSRLESWSKQTLTRLGAKEKAAYAEFKQKIKHTKTEISGYKTGYSHSKSYAYTTADGYNTADVYSDTVGTFTATKEKHVVGDPSGNYASKMLSIAKAKSKTLEDLEWYYDRLLYLRSEELAELEKAENLQRANVLSVIRFLKNKPNLGMISGTVNIDNQPCVIIDGEILQKGDKIHGVKILKICKYKVELQKNDQKWTQAVGETPSSKWQ